MGTKSRNLQLLEFAEGSGDEEGSFGDHPGPHALLKVRNLLHDTDLF